jgi:hypothetical protein
MITESAQSRLYAALRRSHEEKEPERYSCLACFERLQTIPVCSLELKPSLP